MVLVVETAPGAAPPGGGFVGDPSEAAGMLLDLQEACHELQLGLARREYLLAAGRLPLAETGDAADPEPDEPDEPRRPTAREALAHHATYFKNWVLQQVRLIVDHLRKLKAWLATFARETVARAFGPRKEWLQRNRAELLHAQDFGGESITVGKGVMARDASRLPGEVHDGVKKILNTRLASELRGAYEHRDVRTPGSPGESYPRLNAAALGAINGAARIGIRELSSAALSLLYVGEDAVFKIAPSDVERLVRQAEATFENVRHFESMRSQIDEVAALAEREAADARGAFDGTDDEIVRKVQAALHQVRLATSALTGGLAAAVGVNARVNAQAMGALARCLAAARRASAGRAHEPAPPGARRLAAPAH